MQEFELTPGHFSPPEVPAGQVSDYSLRFRRGYPLRSICPDRVAKRRGGEGIPSGSLLDYTIFQTEACGAGTEKNGATGAVLLHVWGRSTRGMGQV